MPQPPPTTAFVSKVAASLVALASVASVGWWASNEMSSKADAVDVVQVQADIRVLQEKDRANDEWKNKVDKKLDLIIDRLPPRIK